MAGAGSSKTLVAMLLVVTTALLIVREHAVDAQLNCATAVTKCTTPSIPLSECCSALADVSADCICTVLNLVPGLKAALSASTPACTVNVGNC